MNPICPYCNCGSEKVTGREVYPHRRDLADKFIYRCMPCNAHVGCHPSTDKPLGRLANARLRMLKMNAHACFDPLWKQGLYSRSEAYSKLAEAMGISREDCHIGMFDEVQCQQVIDLCNSGEIHRHL